MIARARLMGDPSRVGATLDDESRSAAWRIRSDGQFLATEGRIMSDDDEDELRSLIIQVRRARKRLAAEIEAANVQKRPRKLSIADTRAALQRLLTRSRAIRRQSEILRKRRKAIH